METSSEIVQSSPLEDRRGVGAGPKARRVRESRLAIYTENMVLNRPPEAGTYSIIHSSYLGIDLCVLHPVLGTGNTAVNKMDKNHCLVELTTQCRKHTISIKRKKMYPMLEGDEDRGGK